MLKKIFACFLLFVVSVSLPAVALAEVGDLGMQCAKITESTSACPDISSAECKSMLQQCADYYDQQSAQLVADITKTSQQKNTLQNQINSLKNKIKSLEADINQGTIMVKDLNVQISDTQDSINKTSKDIQDSQSQLSAILRSVYEEDRKSLFVVLLEGSLSDFFGNLAYLDNLNSRISDLLDDTKNLKSYLGQQQVKMSDNVSKLQKTIALQSLQKKQNEQNKQQQDQYLKLTEAQYQQQLKEKQEAEAKSAKIKSMLFQLAGVTKAPTFGEAIDIAKAVSNMIPIRPAFLLAVISQESALGRNVGNCLLTDSITGVGKKISTGATVTNLLNPKRDLKPYLSIVSDLGKDPYNSILSCPISSRYDGGSMGPAQFIPSTWNLFVSRLKDLFGRYADPWVIQDAFTASAMYLSDLGATTNEANAAYRYNGSGNMARVYSRSVMNRASCIQKFIDDGSMTSSCQSLILGK